MGSAPARRSPTPRHAPLLRPRRHGQRCSRIPAPAATQTALAPGRRAGSRGETPPEQPGTGTGGLCQASRAPGKNLSPRQGSPQNQVGPRWASLTPRSRARHGDHRQPHGHPTRQRPVGSAAGERPGRETQQSRDAGGGGGTRHRWPLPQQRQLCAGDQRGVCGDRAGHRPGVVPGPAPRGRGSGSTRSGLG